ncbi:MAG: ABC transporter permease [Nitrospinae bacterium]|nr:ABC transporter permease [Nitrospinota bacterium]
MRGRKIFSFGMAIGVAVIFLAVLTALLASRVAPHDPYQQELIFGLEPPSAGHPMGRDLLGRDVLSRIIHGTRTSLIVGVVVVGISLIAGALVGAVSGAFGGWVDLAVMRVTDVALAFPGLLLAVGVMAALGPGFGNLLFALCLTGWASYARLARGQIIALREREFVTAAISAGAGKTRLIFFHYLPNSAGPLLVEATFGMAGVIIAEAGLSFLGLGIQPPEPSWGSMLNEGRAFLLVAPHLTIFPGLCLMSLALAVNLVGDRLREIFLTK